MSRILSKTGEVAGGDGLLKRALELRRVAQATADDAVAAGEPSPRPIVPPQSDAEKKKPLLRSSTRAA